jgi:hypothetical protein
VPDRRCHFGMIPQGPPASDPTATIASAARSTAPRTTTRSSPAQHSTVKAPSELAACRSSSALIAAITCSSAVIVVPEVLRRVERRMLLFARQPGRAQRSCWYPWFVVFCLMLPWRPCWPRWRCRSTFFFFGAASASGILPPPGPFGLALSGGMGGIWLIRCLRPNYD